MANILFIMRPNTGQKIYLSYRWGNDKLLYATGLKINPLYWNSKKHRVRSSALCLEKDIINNRLDELESLCNKWITEQVAAAKTINKDTLRAFLDSIINPQKVDLNTLHGYISDFIERAEHRTGNNGAIIGRATLLSYKRAYKYLQQYEEENNLKLEFLDMGLMFYERYTTFLQKKGLSANSIGREIKTIKIFLNDAKKHGKKLSSEYLGGVFKVTSEESENIYLTVDELKALQKIDYTNNPPLERVRDLFLIGCYTGLRFSDFTRITPANISDNIITIVQQKTGAVVEIPLHPVVSAILRKYGGELPPVISNQKFNKQLNRIAQAKNEQGNYIIAGNLIKTITRGGVQQTHNIERWRLVKSHTARRSFATNLYLSGYPSINIMKITGHKTESAFLKYIKISTKQSAKMLQIHWREKGEYLVNG